MATFNGKDGVWRTVGGRHIFIANGQSLKDAMKASGKFDNIIGDKEKSIQNQYGLKDKRNELTVKEYLDGELSKEEFRREMRAGNESTETIERIMDSKGDKSFVIDKDIPDNGKSLKYDKSEDDYYNEQFDAATNDKERLAADKIGYVKDNDIGKNIAKKLPYENPAREKAESLKNDYLKYYNDYKKYADKASAAGYGTEEYQKYTAKRSEAYQKAMEAKVGALTEFHKTIPYDEMFEAGKQVSGSKSAVFGEPELVNKNGSFYVHYSSNDIKADAGVFSSVLKGARLENFNSELYIDKQTGELTYWGSMDIRYQHNGGGSNGMKIMDYRYKQSTGWDITDSAGYKYKNGKKITTVSGLTNYYMEYYGYSKENAKKMAEASLDDVHRRESMINY